jgi:phenylalanine-4-hydroxylase
VYSSGLQVSGVFTDVELDASGEAVYLKTTGPTALAVGDSELSGHGIDYHSAGFGSPIGLLRDTETPLEQFTDAHLRERGLVAGQWAELAFASGVTVQGRVKYVRREGGQIVLIGFEECTVELGDKVLFAAEWGTFDMAVGQRITSVYAGVADPENFHAHAYKPSETRTARPTYSEQERVVHGLYGSVRELREGKPAQERLETEVRFMLDQIAEHGISDWLLRVEILELLAERRVLADVQAAVRDELSALAQSRPEWKELIENGLRLV